MSILKLLGLAREDETRGQEQTNSLRQITEALRSLEPEQARFVASFAYILGRVAIADLDISEVEREQMRRLLERHAGLSPEEARLAVEIAAHQTELAGGTQDYLIARELKQTTTLDQRQRVLDCLFAVSAADDSISSAEESAIRQIASELGLGHREFVDSRRAWSDKRAVIQLLRESTGD